MTARLVRAPLAAALVAAALAAAPAGAQLRPASSVGV